MSIQKVCIQLFFSEIQASLRLPNLRRRIFSSPRGHLFPQTVKLERTNTVLVMPYSSYSLCRKKGVNHSMSE